MIDRSGAGQQQHVAQPGGGLQPQGLLDIMSHRLLRPHFQPVVDIVLRTVYGYESLIRGPQASPWHEPAALFREAERLGVANRLELDCVQAGIADFPLDLASCLFLNLSATALLQYWRQWGRHMPAQLLGPAFALNRTLVIELSGCELASVVADDGTVRLGEAMASLREAGVRIALDGGLSAPMLRLWADAQPDLIKLDRHVLGGIAANDRRQQLARGLVNMARSLGTGVVAAGIENADDLDAARDLGIRYAQGWLLGRPDREPVRELSSDLQHALERAPPVQVVNTAVQGTVATLRLAAPTVSVGIHVNDDVHRLFVEHPALHAVAVLDAAARPVGIVPRRTFSERYALRYTRELFGRSPCTSFMNDKPVTVDRAASIAQLSHILLSEDQSYLVDGFIITHEGQYDGLGTGETLVRAVTEMRIEAARYANPLTALPGNIPISQQLEAHLSRGKSFVACYADLDHFKPFNDVYGYWRGDAMIRLCADVILRHADPQRDFVGHVGGDDFVILFLSPDWERRARALLAEFATEARALYDEADRAHGGLHAEDRHGVARFFPCVTLGLGAVRVDGARTDGLRAEDVASAAAQVKRRVKRDGVALLVEDYGKPGAPAGPLPG